MRGRRICLRLILVAVVLLSADWAANRLLLADGVFFGRPVAPFDPPLFSRSQKQALARLEQKIREGRGAESKFDAELGWCNHPDSGFGEFRYDWAGARIGEAALAREKAPGVRRIVAIGCSMTHGEEVAAREAWCSRLDASLPKWEVANLGVAAYGIDQALLRLRRDGFALQPDEVWLGILPRAALRVTTRFRPLLDHWSLDVAFKPRFILGEDSQLELEPCPTPVIEDIPLLLANQAAFLECMQQDTWVARARFAYLPRGSSWLHSSFGARILLTAWERTGRSIPRCFDEQHEFGRLYTALVQTVAAECAAQGVLFRVVVLPGKEDLEDWRESEGGYWTDWVERRRSTGVKVIDLSGRLMSAGVELDGLFAPEGHYNAEASVLVAGALAAELPP
jgi:hypothetical protein